MNEYALIVDDNGDWRDLLSRAVERVGLGQDSASTPHRAIELVRKRRYRIVLLDPDLGTGKGIYDCTEILAELKMRGPDIPTILVSAHEEARHLANESIKNYNMLRYFPKHGGSLLDLDTAIREMASIPPVSEAELDFGKLSDNLEYRFAFMRIDIAGHSKLYSVARGVDLDETLDEFENFVENLVKKHNGHLLSWQGDGGLAAFIVGDKVTNCADAALDILYSLRGFNDTRNKSRTDLRIRIACHAGTAKYRAEHGRIHSAAINFVSHLEAKGTSENAIAISVSFHEDLNAKLKTRFTAKREFEDELTFEHVL